MIERNIQDILNVPMAKENTSYFIYVYVYYLTLVTLATLRESKEMGNG